MVPRLDFVGGLKTVQLIQQLQHRALHLGVAAPAAALHPGRPYAVHLVHEDDAGRMLPATDSHRCLLRRRHSKRRHSDQDNTLSEPQVNERLAWP